MKINLIKTANNKLWPADEEAEQKLKKLKIADVYIADVKVNQNYELHKKIFAFFGFCTNYWYGDIDASKDKYQLERTREKLTISAGYYRQVFIPGCNGGFEVVAQSIAYENMPDDERQDFYKRVTQAAIDNIFQNYDDNTINQLLNWF